MPAGWCGGGGGAPGGRGGGSRRPEGRFLDGVALAGALDSSFRIIERCLDHWTWDLLAEEVRLRPEDGGPDWVHTRGWVLQRVFSHDVYHCRGGPARRWGSGGDVAVGGCYGVPKVWAP